MKTYLIALLVFLSGCASLKYDPVEYDRFVTISTTAELGKDLCSSPMDVIPVASHLVVLSKLAVNNAKYRTKVNEEKMATEIYEMTKELRSKYGVNENVAFVASKGYCEIKMTNISVAAKIAAQAVGSKR